MQKRIKKPRPNIRLAARQSALGAGSVQVGSEILCVLPDEAAQRTGFYSENARDLVQLFPDKFKLLIPKDNKQMPNQRRASAYQIAFSPAGARQTDSETATAQNAITALLPETSKNFFTWQQTFEEVMDCSGEELRAKILTGEIGQITITFDCVLPILSVFSAYGMGVAAAPTGTTPKTHALAELPVGSYQPPYFSLIAGFKGQATPLVLRGCVVNSFKVSIKPRAKITCEVNIKFIDALDATGYVFPVCSQPDLPLRSADTVLTVGGTNFATAKRQRGIDFSFSNNIVDGDFAFTDDSTKPTRLERADRRTRGINYAILGDDRDAEFTSARSGAEAALSLKIAKDVNNSIEFLSAQAFLELNGGGLQKDGQVAETNIGITATPENRMTAAIINSQAATYLTAA